MINIVNFDKINAYDFDSEKKGFKLGYKECIIVNAYSDVSKNGNEMLVLDLDINSGDDKGYFSNLYKNSTSENKFWGCKYYQLYDRTNQPQNVEMNARFKGLITSIVKSNPNYKWNGDESTLKGKLIGGEFVRKERQGQDGVVRTNIVFYQPRSVGNHELKGRIRLLNGQWQDYEEYLKTKKNTQTKSTTVANDIDVSELPF